MYTVIARTGTVFIQLLCNTCETIEERFSTVTALVGITGGAIRNEFFLGGLPFFLPVDSQLKETLFLSFTYITPMITLGCALA
jgi:hypothetical protein